MNLVHWKHQELSVELQDSWQLFTKFNYSPNLYIYIYIGNYAGTRHLLGEEVPFEQELNGFTYIYIIMHSEITLLSVLDDFLVLNLKLIMLYAAASNLLCVTL